MKCNEVITIIIELIKVTAWPLVIFAGLIIFRTPLCNLIDRIKSVEYSQDKEGKKQFRTTFIKPVLDDAKQNLGLPQQSTIALPPPIDPKQTIFNALVDLEITAEQKLKELKIDYQQSGFKNTALVYLETKGTFPPKIGASIQNLIMLKNQVAQYPSNEISAEDANEYIRVKDEIKKVIEAIQELPAIQLNAIVMIMRNISCIIDTGKYAHITINEIYNHIKNESILTFISELDGAQELKGILRSNLWKGFDHFYTKSLLSIYNGYAGDHSRKWGIENSGLCLALAWTIEIIQMGSGWHPEENLSELKSTLISDNQ